MAITNLQLQILSNAIMAPIETEVRKMYAKKLASREFKQTVKTLKSSGFIKALRIIDKAEKHMEKLSKNNRTMFDENILQTIHFHKLYEHNYSPNNYKKQHRNIPDTINIIAKKIHGLDVDAVLAKLRYEVDQNLILSDMKNHSELINTITKNIKSKLNGNIWKN